MDIQQALHTALEFERKGYQMYSDAAKTATNEVLQKIFQYLADQEVLHVGTISKAVEQNDFKFELTGDNPEAIKDFFSTTTDEFSAEVKAAEDEMMVLEVALDLEQNAYDFYNSNLAEAEGEDVQTFFRFMMEQEKAHYEEIKKLFDTLKDM